MIKRLRNRFIRIATLSVAAVMLLTVINYISTDASHELKTPITVIATSLKVLEMEVGRQKWIDKARGQTEKLTSLVNSLVTLSRMDEEESPSKKEPFPISDAVWETAGSFTELAASAGHPLTVQVTEGLVCCGDEYAVRQLTSILLDNAVKYAAPDSPITLTLEKSRRGVVLRTTNRCEDAVGDGQHRAARGRTAQGLQHAALRLRVQIGGDLHLRNPRLRHQRL